MKYPVKTFARRAYSILTAYGDGQTMRRWLCRAAAIRCLEARGTLKAILPDAGELTADSLAPLSGRLAERFPDLFAGELPSPSREDAELILNGLRGIMPDGEARYETTGWVYQHFTSVRRAEVINIYRGTVRREDIPAATQIFTPEWVVRYITENTLGRLWLNSHPDSGLDSRMEYLLRGGKTGVAHEKVLSDVPDLIDPCCGSGNIMLYAFELMLGMYAELGVPRDEAARRILSDRLCGTDIDENVCAVARFVLAARAAECGAEISPELMRRCVRCLEPSRGMTVPSRPDMPAEDVANAEYLVSLFENADEAGSLIVPDDSINYKALADRLRGLGEDDLARLAEQADILSRRYCAVCTNPPYMGKTEGALRDFLARDYGDYRSDLFGAFLVRCRSLTKDGGLGGYMTPLVWLYIRRWEQLRRFMALDGMIHSLIRMEYSALGDASVPVCAFVAGADRPQNGAETVCVDLSGVRGSMEVQRDAAAGALRDADSPLRCRSDARELQSIPTMPLAFGAGKLAEAFSKGVRLDSLGDPKQGLATADNSRFLRMRFEVDEKDVASDCADREKAAASGKRWFPYNKGGGYRKWYGGAEYVINWENDGEELSNFPGSVLRNRQYYFREGVSWCKVTSGPFSARFVPAGGLFDVAGCTVFTDEKRRNYLLGFLNSSVCSRLLGLLSPTINYEVGSVASLPVVFDEKYLPEVNELVGECVRIAHEDHARFEPSHEFSRHPIAPQDNGEHCKLSALFERWKRECSGRREKIARCEKRLDEIFAGLYGLEEVPARELPPSVRSADRGRDVRLLLSWMTGCILGRYSHPACEPVSFAVLNGAERENDLASLIIRFVADGYGRENLEENLRFIADALDGKGTPEAVLRRYASGGLRKDHARLYSGRPVYWLFGSGSDFSALVWWRKLTPEVFAEMAKVCGDCGYADRLNAHAKDFVPDPNGGIRANRERLMDVLAEP